MAKTGNNKIIQAGVGYTIANILIKGLTFLTLPLFSRIMTTDQFGVYNVFVSYETVLSIVVGFAIHSSIKSANLRFKGEIDAYTSSVSLIYIFSCIGWMVFALFFKSALSDIMELKETALPLLVIYSFGSAVVLLYNNRLSLNYSYKRYLIVALINALSNIGLSLILMFTLFSKERDMGRIIGVSTSIFLLSTALLAAFFRKAKPQYSKEYWQFALRFSLPMVPHGVSQVLLGQFDRIMIQKICGNSDAGVFSLAGNVKMIAMVLNDSLITTWGVWFFEKMKSGDNREIQKRATQLCILFCIVSVGLISVCPELISILGGERYEAGKFVAIPMVIDAFLVFVYSVLIQSEYYKNKTLFVMAGTLIAAAIDIILNVIFIPRYGFIAAAYTTLAAYICYLFLHFVISRLLIGFNIVPLRRLIGLILIVTATAAWNLHFVDILWARWVAGVIIVGLMGLYLMKSLGKLGKKEC